MSGGEAVDLCYVDAYTHSTGQCQLFNMQHDGLWVVVTVRQSVKYILTILETCYKVFELVMTDI